jgi:hypothetical protein
MQRFSSALLATLTLASAACGGRQQVPDLGPASWHSVFELVPADAAYALILDPNAADEAFMLQTLAAQSTSPTSPYGILLQDLNDQLGFDLANPDSLRQSGIDLQGELAVFATDITPIIVVKIADTEAWHATVDRMIDMNPDLTVSDWELAGISMTRIIDGTQILDFGIFNGFLVARVQNEERGFVLSDADFVRMLAGPSGDDIRSSDVATSVGSNLPQGAELSTLFFMRTDAVNALVHQTLASDAFASVEAMDAMGITAVEAGGYSSAQQQAACTDAVERIVVTWPFTVAWGHRVGDQRSFDGGMLMQFSEAGAERISRAFPGVVQDVAPLAAAAAIYAAGRIDAAELLNLFPPGEDLLECPDLARLPAGIDALVSANRRTIDRNLRLFNGGGALAIFNLTPAGFSVDADAAVMITSDNPADYGEVIRRLLESNGFTGSVVAESAITTINYDSFLFSLSMVLPNDRVVLHSGDLEPPFINALALNPEGVPGEPFFQFGINSRTFETMYNSIVEYLEATGAMTPELSTSLASSFASIFATERMDVTGAFRNNAIVITSQTTPRSDAP